MAEMVHRQERTANNLANADTVGFRRERTFANVLQNTLDAEGAPRTTRREGGWADQSVGSFEQSGNPFDVALENPEAFFVIQGADGAERYTRAGRFTLDSQGVVRTPGGDAVQGVDGPITIPEGGQIAITDAGEVQVNGSTVGTLRIVEFADRGALQRTGDTAFVTPNPPAASVNPRLRQGFVETSNVDTVREMTDMIAHFRLYEAQQKVIQSQDGLLGEVTQSLSKF